MGNNTPFPDLGSLCGKVFFLIFFIFLMPDFYLHLSREVMSKLVLVLCLSGIAVLAKPSRLQAKTDVREMNPYLAELRKFDDPLCAEKIYNQTTKNNQADEVAA